MIENSRIDPAHVQQEQEEGRKAGIAFATYDPGDGRSIVEITTSRKSQAERGSSERY